MSVDTTKRTHFCDSFCAAVDNITKGLSISRASVVDGYWYKCFSFCRDMSLKSLLILYRYPFPILNAFAQKYRTREIAPRKCQVQSHTVEDFMRLISEALFCSGIQIPPPHNPRGTLYLSPLPVTMLHKSRTNTKSSEADIS